MAESKEQQAFVVELDEGQDTGLFSYYSTRNK